MFVGNWGLIQDSPRLRNDPHRHPALPLQATDQARRMTGNRLVHFLQPPAAADAKRATTQERQDEALWLVYQLNARSADARSGSRRRGTFALAVIVLVPLALAGVLIWASW